jgi:hypothetical protein
VIIYKLIKKTSAFIFLSPKKNKSETTKALNSSF